MWFVCCCGPAWAVAELLGVASAELFGVNLGCPYPYREPEEPSDDIRPMARATSRWTIYCSWPAFVGIVKLRFLRSGLPGCWARWFDSAPVWAVIEIVCLASENVYYVVDGYVACRRVKYVGNARHVVVVVGAGKSEVKAMAITSLKREPADVAMTVQYVQLGTLWAAQVVYVARILTSPLLIRQSVRHPVILMGLLYG